MLHGDREPVPSDLVDIEFQNLNSCTELPEEMTSIFKRGSDKQILVFDFYVSSHATYLKFDEEMLCKRV